MRPIAWMFWSRTGGPSQRWSKGHRTEDEKTTLCGLKIPDAFVYDHGDTADRCLRCFPEPKVTR